MCLGVFLFGLLLYGTLHFLDLAISFPKLKRFSIIIYSHIFLAPFFISSSEVTIMQILVGWMLSQRLLQTVLIFFFFFVQWQWFPWRRQWHPTPVLLPGKSHGRRSLVCCSPMGSLRVRHDWTTSLSLFTLMHWRRKWQPTPVFLPGESQGPGSLVGCRLWGSTESDTTEVT